MKNLYQRAFEQIVLSEEKIASIRAVLSSDCTAQQMEETTMKTRNGKYRLGEILVAILLVFGIGGAAFACGSGMIEVVGRFMTGGVVEHSINEDGELYSGVSFGGEQSPVELRADGRLYLVIGDEEKDITDLCSYTTPYIYECTDEMGLRHAFMIGGDLDAIGWSEFFWDANGMPSAGSAMFGTSGGREDAPWLDAGMKTLGLPW